MISSGHTRDRHVSKKSLVFTTQLCDEQGAALPGWALELSSGVARLTPGKFMLNSQSKTENWPHVEGNNLPKPKQNIQKQSRAGMDNEGG